MSVGVTVLQVVASLCTLAMIVSSTPAVFRIYKQHDTGDVALFPLAGLWLSCHLVMMYGWATGAFFPLFATYCFGEVMSIIYVSVFYRWTSARAYALKTICATLFVILLLTVYTTLGMTGVTGQSIKQVGDVVGYMMTIGCLLPYAGPLETVRTVVKTRNGASIPFGMCLAGGISNALWVLEGYLVNDMFMMYLSIACSAMSFVQVTLYLIYRPGRYAPHLEVHMDTPQGFILPVTTSKMSPTSDTSADTLASPNFIAICSPK